MRKTVILITGNAGFIGSNLSRFFLKKKKLILGIDNLKLGKLKNIKDLIRNKNYFFKKLDITNFNKLDFFIKKFLKSYKIKTIWHLAANSDIKDGSEFPDNDYNNTFLTTYNLIKIAKKYKIEEFVFSSSSAVYGDLNNIKLKESSGPLLPISNYGAMKLASEGIISSAKESFLKKIFIFRFPNVVGSPSTHGIIHDLLLKLRKKSNRLRVLGNGKQKKIYMHIDDLIKSMVFIYKNSKEDVSLFNIGPKDSGVTVNFISKEIVRSFKKNKKIIFEKKSTVWIGDVTKFRYSTGKLKKLGLDIKISSKQSIIKAINDLVKL